MAEFDELSVGDRVKTLNGTGKIVSKKRPDRVIVRYEDPAAQLQHLVSKVEKEKKSSFKTMKKEDSSD